MSNKVVPYSMEAEESLLGNMLLYKESIKEVVESGMVSEDFYFAKHQRLFNIITTMYENKQDVDYISLADKLKDYDYFEKIGGLEYLMRLTDLTVSAKNTSEYIRIIKKKSISRQIIKAGEEIASEGYEGNVSLEELIDTAEAKIRNINRNMADNNFLGSEVFESTIEKVHKIQESGSAITGVRTLFTDLDKKTAGFQKGDLIILAARPSMGKTALALNFALNAASVTQGGIAIFSLEMPAEQLAIRMLSAKSEVPISNIRTGTLNDDNWSRLNEAKQILVSQNYFIDDTPGNKVADMMNKCRSIANENNLSLIIIDYIQLIQATTRSENRQQEVSEISRRLKAMAREFSVPVIALSQLSRSVESRQDKRPQLSDLRESGALEQDADLVLFLYREDYYDRSEGNNPEKREDVELIIAKHRNGPTGSIKLAFERDINAFYTIKNSGFEES